MTGTVSTALQGRVILITGAGGTLGRTAALACAAEAATVVLLDKNQKAIEAVYDEIMAAHYPVPALYPLDLGSCSDAHAEDLAACIEQAFGRLDALLHAAAEPVALGPVIDIRSAEMERAWRVNCAAPLQVTRAALPLMTQTGDAAIVFTSDSGARRGKAFWGAYGITKLAMEGLARILADELQGLGRIRVNTLVPGPFCSPFYLRAYPGADRETLPRADWLRPVLVYLLGPASRGVNGQIVDPNTLTPSRTQRDLSHVRS